MEERVRVHRHARAGEGIIHCSDEERWSKPDKWAVMKEGRKSALRLLDSRLDAQRWCVTNDHVHLWEKGKNIPFKKGISIVHRPGEDTRCEHYCAVSSVCPQYASAQLSRTTRPDVF